MLLQDSVRRPGRPTDRHPFFLAPAARGDRRHCVEPADLLRVSSPSLRFMPALHSHLLWPSLIPCRLLRRFLLPDWPRSGTPQQKRTGATCSMRRGKKKKTKTLVLAPAGHKQAPYPPYDCTWQHGLCLASFNYS
jgi:hypothetical protein